VGGMGDGGERERPLGARAKLIFPLSYFPISFVSGARTPRLAHSALPRATDFLCSSRAGGWCLLYFLGHISRVGGWRCLMN
jgi:hypothetical protein